MISLLILYELNKKVYTMYGLSKQIKTDFSVITLPSFGTINPALKRMEEKGFIQSQKSMSKGGRPSVYYAITNDGKKALKEELLSPVSENPIQFLSVARTRLYCGSVLSKEELKEMIKILKFKAEMIKVDTDKLIQNYEDSFFQRMVIDNLSLEYKNFISLLEEFSRACNS